MFDLIQLWLAIAITLSVANVIAGIGSLITLNDHYKKGLQNSNDVELHDYWWATSMALLIVVVIMYGLVWLVV